jgi:DNA helicase HerA-like ATPase
MSSSSDVKPAAPGSVIPHENLSESAQPRGGPSRSAATMAAARVENYVGTLVGESTSGEFRLALAHESVREQDLIAVDAELRRPGDPEGTKAEKIRVWAKVRRVERVNPLFPTESGHELAATQTSPFDTVLSMSREMVSAVCQVLGYEDFGAETKGGKLGQLRYPPQPASSAYRPARDDIGRVVVGDLNDPKKANRALDLAHLANRDDVDVKVDGHAVVTRHLAILAMTGSGKTWTARRLIEQLAAKKYPIVIFDPHGDYSGLADVPALKAKVRRYHARFDITSQPADEVMSVVEALAGKPLAETMQHLFEKLLAGTEQAAGDEIEKETRTWLSDYLGNPKIATFGVKANLFLAADLAEAAWKAGIQEDAAAHQQLERITGQKELRLQKKEAGYIKGSISRIRKAAATLFRMEQMNKKVAGLSEPLPDDRTTLVRYDGISVISLAGYTSEFQSTIYRHVAEGLLEGRLSGDLKLPVLLVLEEGHNFAPGDAKTAAEKAAVEITRQIAQEGRKFGVGMVLISQRPGRLDETVLSMCNSFIVMRMVNPNDQRFVRNVIESLGEDDARILPDLDVGEALFSGQFISFPVLAKVKEPESRGEREESDAFADLQKAHQANTNASSGSRGHR